MNSSRRITEVERQLLEQKEVVAQALARLRGIESELDALRSGPSVDELSTVPRTEAILAVLRKAGGTVSPSEILSALLAAGRPDVLRDVTGTLDYLLKKGAVQRPTRGRYLAT